MLIGSGRFTYQWLDRWARLPDAPGARENGRTHGVAVRTNGEVIIFAQSKPAVLFYDSGGTLLRAWGDCFAGAHGLTLVEEHGVEFLWLTDQHSGDVVKTTTEGEVLLSIAHPPKSEGEYSPTWVAVNPDGGDIWVADGYGSNRVRRYHRRGHQIGVVTGEEGPGRFARAHGIAFSPSRELFVADRRNKRILVYDGEGRYLRHRDSITHSPCGFAFHDGCVYVPELFGSCKVLDGQLNLIAELGANHEVRPPGGWPDQEGWGNPTLPGWPNLAGTSRIRPGFFNSPHALALSPAGDIYVVEWIIGGRITKLAHQR